MRRAALCSAEALSALAEALSHAHLWNQTEPLCKHAKDLARSLAEPGASSWALSTVVRALIRAQRWKQAEDIARSISVSYWRAEALWILAVSLAQTQQWQYAEDVVWSISKSDQQAKALAHLIHLRFTQEEYEQGYALIERSWLQAETSTFALTIFSSSVEGLVPLKPSLGRALSQRFQWAENFLHEPVVEHGKEESGYTEEVLRYEDGAALDA